MIHEVLHTGAGNPTTGRELADLFSCDIRNITERIESERREGYPICANSNGGNAGYYLAADREELDTYCRRLNKRAGELHKTRKYLLKAMEQMPNQFPFYKQRVGGSRSAAFSLYSYIS